MAIDKLRILVTEADGFAGEAVALLQQVGDLILADLDRPGLLAEVREADVLWVRLRHRIDATVMVAAPRLKLIVSPTTGLNHLDLAEAERRGIRVLSLRSETEFLKDVRATAEHTLALILALLRHVPAATVHVRNGGWERDLFKGRELYGKTIGVIGYGRLGRIVVQYLQAFDVHVLTADPHVEIEKIEQNVTLVPLNFLLQQADLVTLHVNLCEKTYQFFGRRQFMALKPGAWFINTARGELVEEEALLEALQSGHLAGAAVDVLSGENPAEMVGHPLIAYARTHDNLLITPHIGGCTVESMHKTECFLAERLMNWIRDVDKS